MKVSIIMGSKSDWEVMSAACETLEQFGVPYEKKVISAHRTPQFFCDYMAAARDRGVGIVIAGAGGAAHLPGMAAALTSLPVIGIPTLDITAAQQPLAEMPLCSSKSEV